ncbi:hypothetical protein T439DRAFT_323673 [Meredithblackwellia eburnea MCA 4105]
MAKPPAKRSKTDSEEPPNRITRSQAVKDQDKSADDGMSVDAGEDDDGNSGDYDEEDDEAFEYDSEYEEPAPAPPPAAVIDTIVVGSSDEDGSPKAPMDADSELELEDTDLDEPPPEPISKGKKTSRQLYTADVELLLERFGGSTGEQVTNLRREDEQITLSLVHPAFTNGLKLVIVIPDLQGYPKSHQALCYSESEIGSDIESILQEVADLPERADRSIPGLIEYLISRLILGQPAPFTKSHVFDDEDEDEFDYAADEHFYGLSGDSGPNATFMQSLKKDFKELIAAGFRPGYTRVSELDNIISVSKKVNSLGVPVRALQAWDSELLTGEVRYLVLLLNYGSKYPNPDNGTRGEVKFRVGLSPKYKPSKESIAAAFRSANANTYTTGEFEAISLSAPLDSLLVDKFQEILLTRRSNVNVGWAAAEHHCLEPGHTKEAIDKRSCKAADAEETKISGSYRLPPDPMGKNSKSPNNYALLAYSYLVRRFVMCPRFCLICYKKITSGIVALKPFVCESPLCLFQLISMGLGPSLEHEIKTNAPAVDLLVQLTYFATKENRLKLEQQPVGLGLSVPKNLYAPFKIGDETNDFDSLDQTQRNQGLVSLISELPPIIEMQAWLNGADMTHTERSLNKTRKLVDMRDSGISGSAWKLLRWIVASNTSYLKLIEEDDELVQGIPKSYRQFRLVVGSPEKEHALNQAVKVIQRKDQNAVRFPTLYAWHGSSMKNWHSILREGLHFNETINGRAYGHGVYFAKQGEISLGHYAVPSNSTWKGADFGIGKMAALCEIANSPRDFVSSNPYHVVNKVEWIQLRYLIVQRGASFNYNPATENADETTVTTNSQLTRPIPLDPAHPITLNAKALGIPDILPKLEAMDKKLKATIEDLSPSDDELVNSKEPSMVLSPAKGKDKRSLTQILESSSSKATVEKDPFVPVGPELLKHIRVLPPPARPNAGAMRQIMAEARAMMEEQEQDGPTKCGFYLDMERSNDNYFNWILELTGFDPDLPLSKDMKKHGVTSILLEVRFPESFPMSPPFIRVVYPRFLPFLQGGGGHVTAGGSICMDLLTSSGWLPSYNFSAILVQIRMAISSTEPKPARLDPNGWKAPYTMSEAVAGFQRAAAAHGWIVPPELAAMTKQF